MRKPPKIVTDFINRHSRRSLMLMAAGAFLLLVLFLGIGQTKPLAKAQLEAILAKSGFKHASVGHLSLYPSGLRATDIKLDQYGFDEIKILSADFGWPSFLTTGKISNLEIKGMNLSRTADNFSSGGRQLAANLLNLPDYRVAISDITLDLNTGFGAIRVTGDATTEPGENGKSHAIKANIKADQYQLGFTSAWLGTLDKDGALDLAGNVLDGRLNLGPLRVSRFNGWIGTAINSKGYSVQSQLEAGSASFMDVPLQTISIVSDSNSAKDDVIVRSGISGLPDILFTADFSASETDQNFTASLKGKNLGGFLDHIDEAKKTNKRISESLLQLRDFELAMRFQPEKRFVGGPMPFGMTLTASGDRILDGNVLFYPDTFDVRGSLETKPQMALALQNYFKIPSSSIVQNFIRLDGDARGFFGFDAEEKTNQAK